ncbi:MAG: urate hydroxylase PuuD [Pseudomonadales bacterium]|nr:urate hydroxylase PuuD [Pseudomonadales bacterium]
MSILLNHRYALVFGFIVAIVLTLLIGDSAPNHLALARWLHTVAGVFWVGLLYYFNVVQVPALAAASAAQDSLGGAAIAKYVAPPALFWFRWASVVTWVAGAWLLERGFVHAFTLGTMIEGGSQYFLTIGIGAWLGTIMLLNVWLLIWPNQKKILGITPATDEQKARARKISLIVSRVNFVLSIPLLLCMTAATHGLPF